MVKNRYYKHLRYQWEAVLGRYEASLWQQVQAPERGPRGRGFGRGERGGGLGGGFGSEVKERGVM